MGNDAERAAYDALACYTMAHGDPAFIHQHIVDAFGAQQADADTKPVRVFFSLAGLYLHLERGFTGREVQRAHMLLAQQSRDWPTFALPVDRGGVTALDVMTAPDGAERDAAIERWCAAVWGAYAELRSAVIDLTRRFRVM